MNSTTEKKVKVDNEVGRLRRILIHSPDEGIGKIIPTKAQDWLFEDIIHLETMRRKEYDLYVKILLYFLDYDVIHGKMKTVDDPAANRNFYKPGHAEYFKSDKVLEVQRLLADILDDQIVRSKLVAAACSHENIAYQTQEMLFGLSSTELARTLISGIYPGGKMIFAPVPNLIFTRDLSIVVNEHILLNRPAKRARTRETILMKYILHNHPIYADYRSNIVEVTDTDDYFLLDNAEKRLKKVTIEGGDVMMIAPGHLLVGCSERTSVHAASRVIKLLFDREVLNKITVVKIPKRRAYMHIDTTFTQVKRNMWVIYAPFSKIGKKMEQDEFISSLGEKPEKITMQIYQFERERPLEKPRRFEYLEDLLDDISQRDLKSREKTEFIYSGDGVFPFGQREQWTDSCNVLALKEGVVIGYDRNDKTANGFRKKGMNVMHAEELLEKFHSEELTPDQVQDTLILLPSAELSRARGGSHCISQPLLRDSIF